jgi:hypothetical protein
MRVYTLHPAVRDAFHARFRDLICPMLAAYDINVVAAGPSLHDADSYCLLRAFPSLAVREAALDWFYGGEEWLTEHEAAVMAMIVSYNTVVLAAAPGLAETLAAGLAG